MPKINYETVDNWPDLSLQIDDGFTHYNNYIFRGQADAEWKIESTITRALNKIESINSDKTELVKIHFENFKENIRGRCNLDFKEKDENEFWALGQHFGMHTPLLDFTRSPYVALLFSLYGKCESGNRALWAILADDINRINDSKTNDNKIEFVNPLTHHNDRLVNQRGLFLKMPLGVCLEEWVEEEKDFGWVTMYKFTFPDSIRNEALSALNNMNINHLSLFPDLFGSSLYSNYQLEIQPYLERERIKKWEDL